MRTYPYLLSENRPEGQTSQSLTLTATGSSFPHFRPGQYVGLSYKTALGMSPMRYFSIASSPTDPAHLQFGIRITGSITRTLSELPVGTRFSVYGPYGSMTLPEETQPLVLIAGGIGITPFLSMIRYSAARSLSRPLTLLYSNKKKDDVPFLAEIRSIAVSHPSFSYVLAITDEPDDAVLDSDMVRGRVDGDMIERTTGPAMQRSRYFVCGPTSMMEAVRYTLFELGVPEEAVEMESFGTIANARSAQSALPAVVYAGAALVLLILAISIVSTAIEADTVPAITRASATTTPQSTSRATYPSTPMTLSTPDPTAIPTPDTATTQTLRQPRTTVS